MGGGRALAGGGGGGIGGGGGSAGREGWQKRDLLVVVDTPACLLCSCSPCSYSSSLFLFSLFLVVFCPFFLLRLSFFFKGCGSVDTVL